MGTGEAGEGRDLSRFAVRVVGTGEVLEVGMSKRAADAYVETYNRLSYNSIRTTETVPVTYSLPPLAERSASMAKATATNSLTSRST